MHPSVLPPPAERESEATTIPTLTTEFSPVVVQTLLGTEELRGGAGIYLNRLIGGYPGATRRIPHHFGGACSGRAALWRPVAAQALRCNDFKVKTCPKYPADKPNHHKKQKNPKHKTQKTHRPIVTGATKGGNLEDGQFVCFREWRLSL